MGFSREELEQFKKNVATQNTLAFFRLDEGKQLIRLFISPNEVSSQPFYEVHTHWYTNMAGNRAFITCTEGTQIENPRPCPICAKIKGMFASKNAVQVELAKSLHVRKTYAQWVFVLREGNAEFEKKPVVLNISRTAMNQILEEILTASEDNPNESITAWDLKQGRILYVKKTAETKFQTTYTVRTKEAFDLTKEPWVTAVKETPTVISQFRVPTEEEQAEVVQAIEAQLQELGIPIERPAIAQKMISEETDEGQEYTQTEEEPEADVEVEVEEEKEVIREAPAITGKALAEQARKMQGATQRKTTTEPPAGHQVGRSLASLMDD